MYLALSIWGAGSKRGYLANAKKILVRALLSLVLESYRPRTPGQRDGDELRTSGSANKFSTKVANDTTDSKFVGLTS
jgi:hypothetical protein